MRSLYFGGFVVPAILLLPLSALAADAQRMINVTGQGKATAAPDMATITSGVVVQAPEATSALEASNAAMKKIMAVLRQFQVTDRDVRTTNFNVNVLYRHDPQGRMLPEVEDFRVTNQVQVRVRNLADVGKVLDALVQAGSNQLSGISFSLSDPETVRKEARKQAMADAVARAQLYAQAAGVRVGKVLTISEQSAPVPMPVYERMNAMSSAVPVAPGELEVQATVNVQFAIEDAQ